jgi:NhaA family Na+:H+ antiporter
MVRRRRSHRVLRWLAHPLTPIGLLLGATMVALLWANSPLQGSYRAVLALDIGVSLGGAELHKPLLLWINDGLMGIFFFVVGLEIKRELLMGELSQPRRAALALAGAIGGMLVPAVLYQLVADHPDHQGGWGIPMATDIAFALGLLSLLGKRAPTGLKIFLTALAIVDDIGAVLVIAVFYTDTIALVSLVGGLLVFGVAVAANRAGVRNHLFYFLLGTIVWLAFLKSGVHATIAALLMAFTIPARPKIDRTELGKSFADVLAELREDGQPDRELLDSLGRSLAHARAPLQQLEHLLHPIVALIVLPIFALANAGVALDVDFAAALAHPVAVGIVVGLCLGKPVGVVGAAFVAVKLRIAALPRGVSWRDVIGAGCLAGVGFTMALFIAGLAFDEQLRNVAKVGILVASSISALVGLAVLGLGRVRRSPAPMAEHRDPLDGQQLAAAGARR